MPVPEALQLAFRFLLSLFTTLQMLVPVAPPPTHPPMPCICPIHMHVHPHVTSHDMLQALAKVVSDHMGGAGKSDSELLRQWKKQSRQLRRQHGSVVIPISALTAGLARHRALLFKVLADFCQIPCRLLRGQFYTGDTVVLLPCTRFLVQP